MWKCLVLLVVVGVVVYAAHREPCSTDADCSTHGCPKHPGQVGVCEFPHHHHHTGECHCDYPFVACRADNGCAGFHCPGNYSVRCPLHEHGKIQHCVCD